MDWTEETCVLNMLHLSLTDYCNLIDVSNADYGSCNGHYQKMISLYNNRPVYKHISAERTLYWQNQGNGWVITPGNPGDGHYLSQGKSTACTTTTTTTYTNALLCNLWSIKYL